MSPPVDRPVGMAGAVAAAPRAPYEMYDELSAALYLIQPQLGELRCTANAANNTRSKQTHKHRRRQTAVGPTHSSISCCTTSRESSNSERSSLNMGCFINWSINALRFRSLSYFSAVDAKSWEMFVLLASISPETRFVSLRYGERRDSATYIDAHVCE